MRIETQVAQIRETLQKLDGKLDEITEARSPAPERWHGGSEGVWGARLVHWMYRGTSRITEDLRKNP